MLLVVQVIGTAVAYWFWGAVGAVVVGLLLLLAEAASQ